MKRTVKKRFWFSGEEAKNLKKKARKTCLTEAALVRLLVKEFVPGENRTGVSRKPTTAGTAFKRTWRQLFYALPKAN